MRTGFYKVTCDQNDKSLQHYSTENNSCATKADETRKSLTWKTKIFYSVGHIYNDLCASVWFSYTLLYFQLHFQSNIAGTLLLIGQVADAIATPFIGFESDRNTAKHWLCRYGRRKTWHLLGTILVTFSFPFIFNVCIHCENASQSAKFVYYSAFIVMFQFGWAAVQVSHVSLITDLTPNANERIELNAYRQASTVSSSICVYTITWLILQEKGDTSIKKEDSGAFTIVVYIISAIGLVFSLLFHFFVYENKNLDSNTNKSIDLENSENVVSKKESNIFTVKNSIRPIKWCDWFKNINFYKVGFIYMMSRLFVNLTQVYTPLYLQNTLYLPKKSVAIVPFITYISGFFCSVFVSKIISSKINSKILLIVGCLFGLSSCLWIFFYPLNSNPLTQWQIYGIALLFGIGGTIMLITSLAITTDLIGQNTRNGAFVFGAMSFLDKLTNGAVVVVLEQFSVNKQTSTVSKDDEYLYGKTTTMLPIKHYQSILVFVCGFSVILTLLGLLTVFKTNFQKFEKTRTENNNESIKTRF